MSMEEGLNQWLRRKEKSFSENFLFALKAWQSAELTLITKYEVILKWFIEESPKHDDDFPLNELEILFVLRAQPGCVAHQIKIDFIQALLQLVEKLSTSHDNDNLHQQLKTRRLPQLLQNLLNFVLFADVFRSEFKLQTQTYALLFTLYERYLNLQDNILPAHETAFFGSIMATLKDNIKRCSDLMAYNKSYTSYMLAPLTQCLLVLQSHALDYSSDFNELEQQLCEAMSEELLLARIWKLELHVRLRTLDSAIYNRHLEENFLAALLSKAFPQLDEGCAHEEEILCCAAYTLELLRRHDAKLNFKLQQEDDVEQPAIQFLGERILSYVTKCRQSHLVDVLQLCCSTMRLNPMILENSVFRLTVWFMLMDKPAGSEAGTLYAQYLQLLLDMYRRLSRTEKFVTNLLKTVKEECLNSKDAMETNKEKKINKHKAEFNTIYVQLLFNKSTNSRNVCDNNVEKKFHDFPQLDSMWPYGSAGEAFSALVAGLVTKASLVIWKSLLYSLKDLLESIAAESSTTLSNSVLFQLDLHAALLCQYYDGARLAEYWHQYYEEINNMRDFAATILSKFGHLLLQREHEAPAMSAFLECCHHALNSDLILIYYKPDSITASQVEDEPCGKLLSLLSEQEWTMLQQRVVNFGQERCKLLLQRVLLQHRLCQTLFAKDTNPTVMAPLFNEDVDKDTLVLTLREMPYASWLVAHMSKSEKIHTIGLLWQHKHFDLLPVFADNLEALNIISLTAFENLHEELLQKSADSLFASTACNFAHLRKHLKDEDLSPSAADKACKQIVSAFETHAANNGELTLTFMPESTVKSVLRVLQELRFRYLRANLKTLVFGWLTLLYADLQAAEAHELAVQVREALVDFLKFNGKMTLFKYYPWNLFLGLLPVMECWPVYELIFANISTADELLNTFSQDLKDSQESCKLNKTQQRLMVYAIERMSTVRGLGAKKLREHFGGILDTFGTYVKDFFESNEAMVDNENCKKIQKFVKKTLPAFGPYAQSLLQKQVENSKDQGENKEIKKKSRKRKLDENKNENETSINVMDEKQVENSKDQGENKELKKKSRKRKLDEEKIEDETTINVMDEKFQRIYRIYIGHSLNYRNIHAIRLMELAVSSQKQLKLGKGEIEFVLSSYWRQLNEDLKADPTDVADTLEAVIKLIIGNMINEDLLITLRYMHDFVMEPNKYCLVVMQLLNLIAKCHFSRIKGAIFNEQFKQITCRLVLHLSKDDKQHFTNFEHVRHILMAQCTLAENKTIAMTPDALDNMLTLMLDVDIKGFKLNDTNSASFFALHSDMVALCMALIKQRHVLLLTRVPQLMHIFKDLLESLISFKSDREKDAALTAGDLENLTESAHKLEVLMNLIVKHGVEVKRIVPLVLTFIMNLVVTNSRPSTLYPQIKTHVDHICLALIGICDHKAGPFILRMCNEASRQVYESLLKEHSKYHAFKGKV